jgi:hypothetical protein
MEKFHLKGVFTVLDYNAAHKTLLLRNNGYYELNGPNTDLVFASVFYLELPTRLYDVTIYEADGETLQEVEQKCADKINPNLGEKVFVLESAGRKFFIGCGQLQVKENHLDHLDSSIR